MVDARDDCVTSLHDAPGVHLASGRPSRSWHAPDPNGLADGTELTVVAAAFDAGSDAKRPKPIERRLTIRHKMSKTHTIPTRIGFGPVDLWLMRNDPMNKENYVGGVGHQIDLASLLTFACDANRVGEGFYLQ
jgi:hypothetical protein